MSAPPSSPEDGGEAWLPMSSPMSPRSLAKAYFQSHPVIDLTLDDDDDTDLIEEISQNSTEATIKIESEDHPTDLSQTLETTEDLNPEINEDEDQTPAEPVQDPALDEPHPAEEVEQNEEAHPDVANASDQMRMLQEFLANQAQSAQAKNGLDGEPSEDAIDSDEEDAKAVATFAARKRSYEAKERQGQTDITDDIEFQKAVNAEEQRQALRQSRQAYQYAEDLRNGDSMFFPEEPRSLQDSNEASDSEGMTNIDTTRMSSRRQKREVVEIEQDEDDGDEEEEEEPKPPPRQQKKSPKGVRRPRGSGTAKVKKDGVTKPARARSTTDRGRGRGRGGRRGNHQGMARIDTNALFRHNIIAAATANRDQEAQPILQGRNRDKALSDLVASLPEEQRELYHGDQVDLKKAAKLFTSSGTLRQTAMRVDAQGAWKLRGMKSSLTHYQMIGASFLRERENSKTRPYGGLLGDEMGLGKTVMMIANIVDGRPARGPRATLIVVPSVLITQWMKEIDKHTHRAVLPSVIVYRSGSRLIATDPVTVLANHDVVITSYNEVRKSMPRNEPPADLVSEQGKADWWKREWEENRGVLHRISWLRIVLDEAQAIKNHLSKTSEAVYHLRGKFRWAISGTPIQNGVHEFYAALRFLRCDNIGSYPTFCKNFCKPGSDVALQRLQTYLARVMCRRTHDNVLFGRPILQLPPIKPVETIEVEFNYVERAIYQIVKNRFVAKLNAIGSMDKAEKHYRCIFVLLLRLRQLAASPLLLQKTLKELLETEDLERLWRLTESPEQGMGQDDSRETLEVLESALRTVQPSDPSRMPGRKRLSQASSDGGILSDADCTESEAVGEKPISANFRKYLQSLHDSGKWAEANDRSLCQFCTKPPVDPHLTSCMHIYCLSCLNDLEYDAAAQDKQHATCIECGIRFTKTEAYSMQGFNEAGTRSGQLTVHQGRRVKKKTPDDDEEDIDWLKLGGPILQSAKTKGAVKKMKEWWAADENAKIIIFVQFRALIQIFRRICAEQGWECACFHGGMSFEARDMAVEDFTEKPTTKVLIAALKAGGVGLNLVAANRVIIIDLWWNQSVEDQAWCRVFRIGQKRDVEIARFVVKNTVDIDMLAMQKRKHEECEDAMDESRRPVRLSTRELLALFGPVKYSGGEGCEDGDFEDESFTFVNDPYENLDDTEMTDLPLV